MSDPLPPMVAAIFEHPCGERIGLADHPATSYEDGRELGPLYLVEGHGRPFGRTLWRVGSGDAGALDQRCPRCGDLVELPSEHRVDVEQLTLEVP